MAAVLAAALASVACGKKGPPLPPLVRLPAPPDLHANRRGSTVELALVVPGANADGTPILFPCGKCGAKFAWAGGRPVQISST